MSFENVPVKAKEILFLMIVHLLIIYFQTRASELLILQFTMKL